MSYSSVPATRTRSTSPLASQRSASEANLRLVNFVIGNLDLALPIHTVYKVVPKDVVYGSGHYPAGITIVGDQEYTVIDLEDRLFGHSLIHRDPLANPTTEIKTLSYLLLVQLNTGEYIGIPVSQAPTLVEVALADIRVLPLSYRKIDTLSIASHIVKLQENDQVKMIFILDINTLVPHQEQQWFE
jgi:purine-binding chemotaxis protein CheW